MAAYTICITPTADADLLAAIEYYNSQAEDLGYRFADMVGDYLGRIALTQRLHLLGISMWVVRL